jgi:6-pyruvoyltetrahydropterin/6-carboxytetrahydropterin synthase
MTNHSSPAGSSIEEGRPDYARVIRRVHFRASHHYRNPALSAEENLRVFGAQARPHEHDWTLEARIVGPIHPDTGWAVDLTVLDAALAAVADGWGGGDLNKLVSGPAGGPMTPSTEFLARWLFHALAPRVPAPARLESVRVAESPELAAEYPAGRP